MKEKRFREKGAEIKEKLKLFLILLFLFAIVFIYAHMHIRTLNLGYTYILLQNKKMALQNRNFMLEQELGKSISLEKIDKYSGEKLQLEYPENGSIYIIRVPKSLENEENKETSPIAGTIKVLLSK